MRANPDPRLHRRLQRAGWDLAAAAYDPLWRAALAPAQTALLAAAALGAGERVLDVACGTGLVTLPAARAVGPQGRVLGVDLSSQMVHLAAIEAARRQAHNAGYACMDAEALDLPDANFDVALCALGLMYLNDPQQALREMRRVLGPAGRLVVAVWGERARCGWSGVFEAVAAEVVSEVCPLFFRLGQPDALARLCAAAGFEVVEQRTVAATMHYDDADQACDAAFIAGPVALAWFRFGAAARERVCARYLDTIAAWREGSGYRIPCEFVIIEGRIT